MKFHIKSSLILLLLFFLFSCSDRSGDKIDTIKKNGDIVKINSYYTSARKYKGNPKKSIVFIDSAITLAKNKNIDSLYLKSLSFKAYVLSKNENYSKALECADSLFLKADLLQNTLYIARSYFRKGSCYYKTDDYKESFYNYALAKKYYLKLKDSNEVAGKLLNMAIIQKNIGDYGAAKETVIEGLKYQTNITTKKHVSSLYNVLSVVKKEEKKYVKALEYKEKSIQILRNSEGALSRKDTVSLIKLLNSKAVIYIKKGDYQTALELLGQVNQFPIINQKSSLGLKSLVLDNLGVVKGKLNDNEAEVILLKGFRIRDSLKNKTDLNASYIHLCEFYIDKNEFDKALPWAERAYVNAQELKSLIAQKEALHYITKLQNVPQQKYIEAYKKVTDSLTLLSNQVRSIYAEEKYEAHENKIIALEKKKEATEQRFYKRMFLIVGFTLVLLLIVYKYYSDKIKNERNKKEQLETAYTTETRISKRVHDELANDVYSVMTRLQTDDKIADASNKEDIMDSLEVIYNKSRDISRETNSIETDSFTETLKSLFSNYSDSSTNVISKGLNVGVWSGVAKSKRIVVFRVLQELLINMKKHSEATFVVLNFTRSNSEIVINYSDNGVGINSNGQNLKNGLKNAENRIESINGVFIFETELNKGVKVKMSFKI